MTTISAFADEISPDAGEQIALLRREGIGRIEFRGMFGKKVLELSDGELAEAKRLFDAGGLCVSCIGSAIGKTPITGDLPRHFDEFLRVLSIARTMGTTYIRLFSFYCPEDRAPEAYADRIASELGKYIAEAKAAGIVLLHENEKGIFGNTPERCRWLLDACASEHFRAVFDPANFVYYGIRPAFEAYPVLEPYIAGLHIKDAVRTGEKFANVPAGHGQGELVDLLHLIRQSGRPYMLALEPHLKPRSPETFGAAVQAFKQLMKEAGLAWQ